MTPAERERALEYLARTRENLIRTTRNLSPTQLQYRPAADRWSVAECLEHIIVVEDAILKNVERTLQNAPDSTEPAMTDGALLQTVTDRSNPIIGPARLMPSSRWEHDQLRAEFEAARKRTTEFVVSTAAPLRQTGFPHPIFGQFDCYQWILCIGAHGERHRLQAEEVIADAGFPRAAVAR